MKNLTYCLWLFLASVSLVSCSSDSIDELGPSNLTAKVDPVSYTTMELEILDLVNAYREQNGFSSLETLDEGSRQAAIHNQHMIENDEVCHDYFGQRYEALVKSVQAKAVGENVAYGFNSAEAVVKGWINSDSHRENLLGEHTHFGISVQQGKDGRFYFTNIFVRK